MAIVCVKIIHRVGTGVLDGPNKHLRFIPVRWIRFALTFYTPQLLDTDRRGRRSLHSKNELKQQFGYKYCIGKVSVRKLHPSPLRMTRWKELYFKSLSRLRRHGENQKNGEGSNPSPLGFTVALEAYASVVSVASVVSATASTASSASTASTVSTASTASAVSSVASAETAIASGSASTSITM